MFTGIVELLAPIIDIREQDASKSGGGGFSITIGHCAAILQDCTIGDSICINGTCLTVTEFDASKDGGYFKIGVAPETLKKTNLGQLHTGDKVNCERAMQAHTRFGGHFVQGHVDTVAVLQSVVPTGNALTLTLRLTHAKDQSLPLPSSLSPYLIPKGYVTLDGASLTLIDVSPPTGGKISQSSESSSSSGQDDREVIEFSVMLIKHTQDAIGLSAKKAGDLVNVELDMVGKYVHRAVLGGLAEEGQQNPIDAGPDALQGQPAASTGGMLSTLIERTVRKVLAEQKAA